MPACRQQEPPGRSASPSLLARALGGHNNPRPAVCCLLRTSALRIFCATNDTRISCASDSVTLCDEAPELVGPAQAREQPGRRVTFPGARQTTTTTRTSRRPLNPHDMLCTSARHIHLFTRVCKALSYLSFLYTAVMQSTQVQSLSSGQPLPLRRGRAQGNARGKPCTRIAFMGAFGRADGDALQTPPLHVCS